MRWITRNAQSETSGTDGIHASPLRCILQSTSYARSLLIDSPSHSLHLVTSQVHTTHDARQARQAQITMIYSLYIFDRYGCLPFQVALPDTLESLTSTDTAIASTTKTGTALPQSDSPRLRISNKASTALALPLRDTLRGTLRATRTVIPAARQYQHQALCARVYSVMDLRSARRCSPLRRM